LTGAGLGDAAAAGLLEGEPAGCIWASPIVAIIAWKGRWLEY